MQVRCVQACKVQRGQVRTGRRCAAQGDIGKVPRSQALRVSTSTLLDSLTPSPVMHPGRPVEVAPVSPVDRGIRGPWTPVWRGVWAAAAAEAAPIDLLVLGGAGAALLHSLHVCSWGREGPGHEARNEHPRCPSTGLPVDGRRQKPHLTHPALNAPAFLLARQGCSSPSCGAVVVPCSTILSPSLPAHLKSA